jgi:hypothetical protein
MWCLSLESVGNINLASNKNWNFGWKFVREVDAE